MFNSIRKSKTAKGLVGIIAPLMLASGIYFSTPRFSHANLVSDFFVEEIIDPIIDTIVKDLTGKTYEETIKDLTQEEENNEQKKEPCGILYLKDGTIIKNVRYKDDEFIFLKDKQKLKILKEKVLVIDFSKEKNQDIIYLRDGSIIKNVQYQPKNLEIGSYSLGDMEIDQDKIRTLIFGKIRKPENNTPKQNDAPKQVKNIEDKIIKLIYVSKEDGDRDIYSVKSDKSGQRKLTYNTTDDSMPVLSYDQKKIAYISEGRFCIMDADGNNKKLFRDLNLEKPTWIKWHPNGKNVTVKDDLSLYTINVSSGSFEKIMPFQKKVPTFEGEKDAQLELQDIAWFPNNKEVIASFSSKYASHIMICDENMSIKEDITSKLDVGIYKEGLRTIREDFKQGKKGEYKDFSEEKFEQFMQKLLKECREAAKNKKLLCRGIFFPNSFFDITLSHDGKKISISNDLTLITIDKDGKNPKLIDEYDRKNFWEIKNVKWSPDGKKIAFTATYRTPDYIRGVCIKSLDGRIINHAKSFFRDSGTISNMGWVSNDKVIYVKEMGKYSNVFTIENGKEKVYNDNFKFNVNTHKLEEVLNLPFLASEKEVKEYLKYRTIEVIQEANGDFEGLPVKRVVIKNTECDDIKKEFVNYLNTDLLEPNVLALDFYKGKLAFIEVAYIPQKEDRKKTAEDVYRFIIQKYGEPKIRSGQRVDSKSNARYVGSLWETDNMYIQMKGDFQDKGELFVVQYLDKQLMDSFTKK